MQRCSCSGASGSSEAAGWGRRDGAAAAGGRWLHGAVLLLVAALLAVLPWLCSNQRSHSMVLVREGEGGGGRGGQAQLASHQGARGARQMYMLLSPCARLPWTAWASGQPSPEAAGKVWRAGRPCVSTHARLTTNSAGHMRQACEWYCVIGFSAMFIARRSSADIYFIYLFTSAQLESWC